MTQTHDKRTISSMTKPSRTVPVSARALEARAVRRLLLDGLLLRKAREGTRAHQDIGRFFTVDENNNIGADSWQSLDELAADLKLLQPWERLVR